MTQGEFGDARAADAAVEELVQAGVARGAIHKWNIIPEREPVRDTLTNMGRGAKAGLVLGGLTGAAIGATLGAGIDAATAKHEPMPQPTGVRVVVDEAPAGVDVREILRRAGAVNIK